MNRTAYILLWLYVFSLPWSHMLDFGDGVGEIGRVLGVVSFVAAVCAVAATGSLRRPALQHFLAIGFLGTVIASWFWTIDDESTARSIRTCLQTMMVMWLVWQFASSLRKIRPLLFAYVLGAYVSCMGTVQDFRDASFLRRGRRFKAEGWNENDLAVALALAIPMAAYLGSTSRNRVVRWICWAYLLIGPVAIALTASRAGALVAALALGGALLLLAQGKWRIKLLGPVLGIAMVAALLSFVPWTTWERISTITSSPDLNNRVPLWEQSLRIFADHPLRPLGAGASPALLGGTGFVAHNAFLSVLVDEGILGFFCFTGLLVACGLQTRRFPGMERWLWRSLLLCWTAGALTLSWEQVRITWFLFACVTAGIHCPPAEAQYAFAPTAPAAGVSAELVADLH